MPLPTIPGSIHLLFGSCSPFYELVTTVGQGGRSKPNRRRVAPLPAGMENTAPAPGLQCSEPTSKSTEEAATNRNIPAPTIRSGLPFLWSVPTDSAPPVSGGGGVDSDEVPSGDVPQPPPPPPQLAAVRSGLPFLWADQRSSVQVCQHYLRGECTHGISGKINGVCDMLHPKRCNRYLKWGSKHENGCNLSSCEKAHPVLCPKSLDLQCVDESCLYKLHTQKCVRVIQQHQHGGNTSGLSVTRQPTQPGNKNPHHQGPQGSAAADRAQNQPTSSTTE